jgi:N6-L-threonylcarbamoyladenine synthase
VISQTVESALDEAGVAMPDVGLISVVKGPGLIGALLIGVTAAKAASWALGVPLIAVNHLEAHIYGAWLSGQQPALPAVSLVVSGGHTRLFLTESPLSHKPLGSTTDDAAGEAFDKVASILKLGYPGGPAIERAAATGNRRAVQLPRAWLERGSLDFSFSGIKTAVLYRCVGQNASKEDIARAGYSPGFAADVAASFQEAVVEVLVAKTLTAAERTGAAGVILGGGVAANALLRERLGTGAAAAGLKVCAAPRELCRDNGAIVAGLAFHLLHAGRTASLSVEARP